MKTFAVGTTVKLKSGVTHACPAGRQNNQTAKISALLEKAYGIGAVSLDRDLRGCQYWNVEDLEVVK